MREAFGRLSGRTLIALDGTEYFCSQKIPCPHCQTRKRSNGKIESYHSLLAATVVAPGHSKVVPLAPEFIVKQDGAEKQDCERNAAKRWLDKHGARLKPLRPVYLGDDLFACQSVVERLADNGDDFLFTCKEASHKALYNFIDGCEFQRCEVKVRKGKTRETHRYRFVEKIPLRDGKDAVTANWIGFEILDAKGVVKYKTSFVPSLPVTKANVAEIAACGRARWKIENESFNVLKNHGYELEHNFGHGESYLAMTLAALNVLAFAWHTVLDLLEPPWRKAEAMEKRMSFFRLPRNHDEIRRLPCLVRSPQGPRHLHNPTRTPQNPKNRVVTKPRATFRIAADAAHSGHDCALRLRLPVQLILSRNAASIRGRNVELAGSGPGSRAGNAHSGQAQTGAGEEGARRPAIHGRDRASHS